MSYLDSYLQRRREEREAGKYEIDDTPGEKFEAFTNNVGHALASALKNIRKERSIAGAPGSMAIQSNAYESVARKVSADEVKAIGAFSETLEKGSSITNQRLKEAVSSLRSMADTLKDMFNDTISQRRKSEAYSKRGDAMPIGASSDLTSKPADQTKKNGIFDYLDWRKKDRPRPMGTPMPEKTPAGGGAGGGWWDRIKGKMAGGAKEGGGLWKTLGGNLKGAGLVGALVGANSLYEAYNSEDATKNVSKTAGSMLGGAAGWQAGATAGGALGALGGPAAPVTVPIGALIGGLAGAWGGSEIGDAVADSMVDVVRNFDSVPDQIQKVYKNDIVPGFSKASDYLSSAADTMSATAGKMGDAVASVFSGLTKKLSDLGDDISSGAGKAARFAAALPGRAVEAGKEAIKTGADAAGQAASYVKTEVRGLKRRAENAADNVSDVIASAVGANGAKRQYSDASGNTETREGGTRAWRNNNEGNIRYGSFAKKMGAIGKDGDGFAIFPSQEHGRKAKESLLFDSDAVIMGKKYKDRTIDDAISTYAPSSENDTARYQKIVRDAAGVSGNTQMKDLTPEQRQRVLAAMKRHEGWKEGKSKYADANGNAIDAKQMQIAQAGKAGTEPSTTKPYDPTKAGTEVAVTKSEGQRTSSGKIGERKKEEVAVAKASIKTPESANPDTVMGVTVGKMQPQVTMATPSSLAPSVEARRAPVERVPSSEPPESRPVVVTNPDAINPSREARDVAQTGTSQRVVQDSQIPSLDNMPLMINDMGLMLLNVGHI